MEACGYHQQPVFIAPRHKYPIDYAITYVISFVFTNYLISTYNYRDYSSVHDKVVNRYFNVCYFSTECPNQFDELSVWVDDAPDCHADASYCDRYGLLYLCEDEFKDRTENATCPEGTRVRCAFPPPTVEPIVSPVTTLKVIAYNVWELRYSSFK
ncbi:hypothetical protein BSL78_14675 [Apostichopus japonicus]|uniref:Uncharacterized protein n=1 Tax=Stichopus japonicus TaxID=307972 RepID=A0A2G8KKC7_STIJA|nr:hypothetical protein BSL78_14675 [Apostichopus japonicus]